VSAERDAVIEVIYRALVEYDRELRRVRTWRSILGHGPTIKRGTKRAALAVYLADVVLAERAKQERAKS
jgi:hypothetical protein